MGFLNGMDICASGMTAQWLRMDVASENITNADTTRTEGGGPYRRKMVVFEPTNQNASFHNVERPNVDILKETIDSMAASRAYDASLTAFNIFKTMAGRALEIGK